MLTVIIVLLVLENLIVPVAYVLTNLLIILTNDINEFIVGSFGFIFVAGEIAVELVILISQYWRMRSYTHFRKCHIHSICSSSHTCCRIFRIRSR